MPANAAPETLGVRALGSHALEITLERPTPYFLSLLAHQTAVPLNRASLAREGRDFLKAGKLVGDGAYVLQAYAPNDRLTLVRNPEFHDATHVSIEREEILPLEDRGAAIRRFEAHEIDSYSDVPADQIGFPPAALSRRGPSQREPRLLLLRRSTPRSRRSTMCACAAPCR